MPLVLALTILIAGLGFAQPAQSTLIDMEARVASISFGPGFPTDVWWSPSVTVGPDVELLPDNWSFLADGEFIDFTGDTITFRMVTGFDNDFFLMEIESPYWATNPIVGLELLSSTDGSRTTTVQDSRFHVPQRAHTGKRVRPRCPGPGRSRTRTLATCQHCRRHDAHIGITGQTCSQYRMCPQSH